MFYFKSNHPHHTYIIPSKAVLEIFHIMFRFRWLYSRSTATTKQVVILELLHTGIFANKVLHTAAWGKNT